MGCVPPENVDVRDRHTEIRSQGNNETRHRSETGAAQAANLSGQQTPSQLAATEGSDCGLATVTGVRRDARQPATVEAGTPRAPMLPCSNIRPGSAAAGSDCGVGSRAGVGTELRCGCRWCCCCSWLCCFTSPAAALFFWIVGSAERVAGVGCNAVAVLPPKGSTYAQRVWLPTATVLVTVYGL